MVGVGLGAIVLGTLVREADAILGTLAMALGALVAVLGALVTGVRAVKKAETDKDSEHKEETP